MAEVESLVVLEERVRKLEEKIFGPLPKDAEYPEVSIPNIYTELMSQNMSYVSQ